MRSVLAVVGLAFLAFAVGANAQQGTSSIRGRVLDAQGAVLPGVTAVVTHQESGIYREVVSNADGSYFITGIVPGLYRVSAKLDGFKTYDRRDVLFEVGRTVTLDVVLEVGGLEETVTVTGESPLIDLTSNQVGGNITQGELKELPNPTRNWLGFVGLLPGIQVQSTVISFGGDSINVNGQSNRNNNFVVDGGGNNDDYLGQAFGGQTRTALEAIQEFQVLTNQFDAEFGRSTGAVVNAVTKQGTNNLRGSAFTYLTDSALTAKDFFTQQSDLAKPDTHKTEWGGTLGGPVVRDRAHFFGSLERVSIDDGRSNTFAARPELNYSIPQKTRVWNWMVRFDHQLNARNTWGVRYLQETSPTLRSDLRPLVARREARRGRRRSHDRGHLELRPEQQHVDDDALCLHLRGQRVRHARVLRGHAANRAGANAPDADLPRSAGARCESAHQQLLPVRSVLQLVCAGILGRRPRHEIRRAIHLCRRGDQRRNEHERDVLVQHRCRLRPGEPPHLP